ncbi:MAG: WecB/TagA/CpsF family glycosyltransferase [Deltaproteobacteria bacterium]|nr:WecB/TagA/CpsF family glycosyltransferase [Deltaproteobacteria bacterium]MBI3386202.1 WecB/TagA/CpsF family glycosyltransferase [Deltaproteobacteria bacterium]
MTWLLDAIVFAASLVLLTPITVVFVECMAALLPLRSARRDPSSARPRLAVLVPARNEAAGIGACLASLVAQLVPGDRLIVIADNCDDDTAEIARRAGALVLERHDLDHYGKGYALDLGVRWLDRDPPEVVVMIDADCIVAPGSVDVLARAVSGSQQPVQASNLVTAPVNMEEGGDVSALAFLVKNLVRARGRQRIGFPCLLAGSGMAFPWRVIRAASLAAGDAAEDLVLTVQLALSGHLASYCDEARIVGQLANDRERRRAQRKRWEHGHLDVIRTFGPRLVRTALRERRPALFALALDLCVPPLSLLFLLWGAVTGAGSALETSNFATLLGGMLLLAAVGVAWAGFGRETISAAAMLTAPFYVLRKIPLYLAFLRRPQTRWLRPAQAGDVSECAAPFAVVRIGGVAVHAITERQCIAHVLGELDAGRGGWLVTANVDHLHRCARDTAYAELCAQGSLVVADGMPLIFASRIQGTPLPERIPGSNLISSLTAAAAQQGRSIFLLGGALGTAESAANVLRGRHPTLRVAGTRCPALGFEHDPHELARVIAAVTDAAPDIVYVALGKPKQDQLIAQLAPALPCTWFVGVGISFSFLSGDVRRAPLWMQRAGLEWLHRLRQEPSRLAKRYLVDDLPYTLRLFVGAVVARLWRRSTTSATNL